LGKQIQPYSVKSSVIANSTSAVQLIANNATSDIKFSTGDTFYNLNSVAVYDDFTEQSDSYYFCKVESVQVEITRTADESTMNSNLHGCMLLINYYPQITSTNLNFSTLYRSQNTYQIDTMTFDKQLISVPMNGPHYLATTGGVDYWLKPNNFNITSHVQFLQGQFSVYSNNTTNNAALVPLFGLRFKYKLVFAMRK